MQTINKHFKDLEYDAIEYLLNQRKKYLSIREWVTMDDLYVNAGGDIYYVELYDTETSREECHGVHDIVTNTPHAYTHFLDHDEVKEVIGSYLEIHEDKEPHPIVWFGMFLLLSALAWLFLYLQPR